MANRHTISVEHFSSLVEEAFAFLVRDYGFRRTHSERFAYGPLVMYESDRVHITIAYDERDNAIEFGVGLLKSGGRDESGSLFHLDELVRAMQVDTEIPVRAVTDTDLHSSLVINGRILRQHGHRALVGDKSFYEILQTLRSKEIELERLRRLLPHVESAFRNERFDVVVAQLEPFLAVLDQVQRGKYAYALKRIQHPGRAP